MARFSICSTLATFIHKTKHFGNEAGVLLLCLFFVNSNAMHVKIFYIMIVRCVAIATPSIYIALSLTSNEFRADQRNDTQQNNVEHRYFSLCQKTYSRYTQQEQSQESTSQNSVFLKCNFRCQFIVINFLLFIAELYCFIHVNGK